MATSAYIHELTHEPVSHPVRMSFSDCPFNSIQTELLIILELQIPTIAGLEPVLPLAGFPVDLLASLRLTVTCCPFFRLAGGQERGGGPED